MQDENRSSRTPPPVVRVNRDRGEKKETIAPFFAPDTY